MESKINSLVRIAGEAKFVIFHDGEKVLKAHFIATAPVRGFEKLAIGKHPFLLIEAAMRICGVCHAAHGICCCEALEHALGLAPPFTGRLLREAIGLLNRVQSHLFVIALILKDVFEGKELQKELLIKTIQNLEKVNRVLTRLGGAPTHPPYLTIGGVLRPPTPQVIKFMKDNLTAVLSDFQKIKELHFDEDKWSEKVKRLAEVKLTPKFLASHPFYGDRYNVNPTQVKVLVYDEYRPDAKEIGKESSACIAKYGNDFVEVGPRARLVVYRDFNDYRLIGVHLARILEVELCLERTLEIIDTLDIKEPVRAPELTFHEGKGVGVYEAPRGTLFHFIELDSMGRVKNFKVVVPTMFNIPIIEKAAEQLPPDLAPLVARIYDPCIPCATHFIRV